MRAFKLSIASEKQPPDGNTSGLFRKTAIYTKYDRLCFFQLLNKSTQANTVLVFLSFDFRLSLFYREYIVGCHQLDSEQWNIVFINNISTETKYTTKLLFIKILSSQLTKLLLLSFLFQEPPQAHKINWFIISLKI